MRGRASQPVETLSFRRSITGHCLLSTLCTTLFYTAFVVRLVAPLSFALCSSVHLLRLRGKLKRRTPVTSKTRTEPDRPTITNNNETQPRRQNVYASSHFICSITRLTSARVHRFSKQFSRQDQYLLKCCRNEHLASRLRCKFSRKGLHEKSAEGKRSKLLCRTIDQSLRFLQNDEATGVKIVPCKEREKERVCVCVCVETRKHEST